VTLLSSNTGTVILGYVVEDPHVVGAKYGIQNAIAAKNIQKTLPGNTVIKKSTSIPPLQENVLVLDFYMHNRVDL